jgi:hypothetical protein
VETTLNALGQAVAEVDLVTSFNPGDNFRVVVSGNRARLQALNDRTGVPTSGAIPNFPGSATDQLSIWRRVHVEEDRMGTIPFGFTDSGGVLGVIPSNPLAPEQSLILTFQLNFQIGVANRYRGGILKAANGLLYPIISHTTDAPSTVAARVLRVAPLGQLVGPVELIQGDFMRGQATALYVPAGGQLEVTTNIQTMWWNDYAGGVLRIDGQNYPILSNTRGENARFIVQAAQEVPLGPVEVYQDDFVSEGAGDLPPVPRISQPTAIGFYDFAQVSTTRDNNRFADAYLEAEYNALNAFDSNDVTPVSHFPDMPDQYALIADPYRGQAPGSPARPADYETSVFWVVYVLAGYEDTPRFDYDGRETEFGPEEAHLGGTDRRIQDRVEGEVTVVFTEAIRDVAATSGTTLTEASLRARTVVHEIGHQFGLAVGPGVVGGHRDAPAAPNIMSSATSQVSAAQFYFHPADIVDLRRRVRPPGQPHV